MTEYEKKLLAETLRSLAKYLDEGGPLSSYLAPVLRASQGELLPGEPYAELVPGRALDKVERTRKALELLKEKGRLSSGELARVSFCDPETARTTLSALTSRGVVRKVGRKRATLYIPGPKFEALG